MVRYLFDTLMVLILFTAIEIALVGSLWVLRVVIDWWLDVDYVEVLKKWAKSSK